MTDSGRRGVDSTRRRFLAAAGATTAALVAGCSDGSGDDGADATPGDGGGETNTPGTPTPYGEELSPPVRGDADADVTLAVFEDYACPHCADYNVEGFPELQEAYVSTGEVRYEHRDLPIPVANPGSFQAANAARAVQHRQGDEAFWPYSDAVFERSRDISSDGPELFASLAESQGHDPAEIREAAQYRVYRATVERDRQRAIDLGAEATPTFAVDGEIVASGFGSGTVGTLRDELDAALSETG
ncbi:MAG: thioredoxin domain-containing protein [Haloarculaceae archaeon]